MKTDLSLKQKVKPRMMLLPRQQLFLKLLAMPAADLRSFIEEQIEENPVLEADTADGDPSPRFDREPEDIRPFTEALLQQWRIEVDAPAARRIGEFLIGCLDEDGYLRIPLEEIARRLKVTRPAAERALALVQKMDPPGIAARDLREALLLQMERKPGFPSLTERIVREAWELLAEKKYGPLAAKFKTTPAAVRKAVDGIRGLNPYPAAGYGGGGARRIIVEGSVQKDGDGYAVSVHDDYLPKLAVSAEYRGMAVGKRLSPDEKKYLREKCGRAAMLLALLEERNKNLQLVFQEIVEDQKNFLDGGTLLPLKEKEVAERTGLSISTVSRAVSGKYLRTPRGCLRVKALFSGEVGFSSRHFVEERIAEFARAAGRPFSDRRIAETLKKEGIEISVRTVNKYRRRMKFLNSYLR